MFCSKKGYKKLKGSFLLKNQEITASKIFSLHKDNILSSNYRWEHKSLQIRKSCYLQIQRRRKLWAILVWILGGVLWCYWRYKMLKMFFNITRYLKLKKNWNITSFQQHFHWVNRQWIGALQSWGDSRLAVTHM